MRSVTWITVLVSLFMFQSLWNVAAAFCIHEESAQIRQSQHFGHHQNILCVSHQVQPVSHDDTQQFKKTGNDLQLGEDHHDHLPSMSHLIVQNEKIGLLSLPSGDKAIPQFYWNNSYQPPDLFQQSPPPEFSPLTVG